MSDNISNNKGVNAKKKRKFNVVDFLIVVIIVTLVGILIYSFSPWSQIKKLWTSSDISIDYTIEIREVDEEFKNLIKKNDTVIDSVTKSSLGKVTAVELENSKVISYDGKPVEHPNKFDIKVRITAKADYEKGIGYSVNGCRIAVGEQISFRFPKFPCTGYCVGFVANS